MDREGTFVYTVAGLLVLAGLGAVGVVLWAVVRLVLWVTA